MKMVIILSGVCGRLSLRNGKYLPCLFCKKKDEHNKRGKMNDGYRHKYLCKIGKDKQAMKDDAGQTAIYYS